MNDLVVATNPKSSFAEAIKLIKTNIIFSSIGKSLKTVLMTSPESGDGKSFLIANLASAFAQDGKKVLIIDADLRKGRQHKIFKLENENAFGYSNLILSIGQNYVNQQGITSTGYQAPGSQLPNSQSPYQNNQQVPTPGYSINPFYHDPNAAQTYSRIDNEIKNYIKHTPVKGVFLIPAGPTPPNPLELLSSEANQIIIDHLKAQFDVILIDCPPALGLSDALVMSKFADVNIVTVSNSKTTIDELESVKKNFERVDSKIAGVVINRAKQKQSSYSSYYTNDKYYTDTIAR